MRDYTSMSNQKSAAAYSWKLLLNESFLVYVEGCVVRVNKRLNVIIYSTRLKLYKALAVLLLYDAVCMQSQDSSNYSLSWAASSRRSVTDLKLFSEVQPLAFEDQNKTGLVMPLQGCCSVQLYNCTDS